MMRSQEPTRGFTLLEIIVSVGLFAVVMLIATSAYFTIISVDRRARATNQIVSNLTFAMDAMTRGIRTGTNYQCSDVSGSPDANGNSTNGLCTSFSYMDTTINPTVPTLVTYILKSNHTIGRCEGAGVCNDSTASVLSDPTISVTDLVFYVRGAGGSANDSQPQVLFTVKGTMPATSGGGVTTFILEEDATQRLIDL